MVYVPKMEPEKITNLREGVRKGRKLQKISEENFRGKEKHEKWIRKETKEIFHCGKSKNNPLNPNRCFEDGRR